MGTITEQMCDVVPRQAETAPKTFTHTLRHSQCFSKFSRSFIEQALSHVAAQHDNANRIPLLLVILSRTMIIVVKSRALFGRSWTEFQNRREKTRMFVFIRNFGTKLVYYYYHANLLSVCQGLRSKFEFIIQCMGV